MRTIDLRSLLQDLAEVPAEANRPITGITVDSRRVRPGDLFLARSGTKSHGASFVDAAIERGAAAIALESSEKPVLTGTTGSLVVPQIPVPSLGSRIGEIASRFFGRPSEQLSVFGITGTNGKTSVSQFIAQALSREAKVGVIGTLGSGLLGQLETTGHTTPDAVRVQAELARFVALGAGYAVMEVSSHALDQGRVNAVRFSVAVFTNLTHEHLDYHGDMSSYAEAKRRLFEWPGLKAAVLNTDDAVGREWASSLPESVPVISYGMTSIGNLPPTVFGYELTLTLEGLGISVITPWGEGRLQTPLLGRFNAANLLAALGALLAIGMPFDTALSGLSAVRTVPGRMERFGGKGLPLVVVDYAHTPDALEQVLITLREHCQGTGKLLCVFGCGGDRDKAKRPEMGKVAQQLADAVVITNDNPRHEDPTVIVEDIKRGMSHSNNAYVIPDRAEAIGRAIAMAGEGDIVLVAGKGHETEQQIGDVKIPFSDREEVLRELVQRGGNHG